jgi:DNA-binding NarL/FixJ family response regulator
MGAARVLILEDDDAVRRCISREVQRELTPLTVVPVVSRAAAEDVVRGAEADELVAAIVDVRLPDGNGLDVVAALRRRRATLPILVVTGSIDPRVINRAHELRAELVVKPVYRDNLRAFLRRVARAPDRRLADVVDQVAAAYALTPREKEILARAAAGVPRNRLPEVLGVSENTIKSQIRSLLSKTGHGALADVVWRVLGQVGGSH